MILIGQYDSPFVRRVGIALKLYDLPFEHRPWSVFSDADKVKIYNPLIRVPALVLDDGEVLIDSASMIDFLDSLMPPERVLFPRQEPERRRAMKVAVLAMGLAEKAVSLFYEKNLHREISEIWAERCKAQILSAVASLQADCSVLSGRYWFEGRIGHADIAVAVALRFLAEAHPGLADWEHYPALVAHAGHLEALPVFGEISQAFIAPA